ncbi:unnamed protein product, partial [Lymnaea stagnalis]
NESWLSLQIAWQDTDKMATIRRTDIIQKKFSKGRPAKSERERTNRRQEAYKWRDARRIYLASSFDRWRKLRSTLKLKDSSLAWHLMEAHEKGPCSLCRQANAENALYKRNKLLKNDQKEFLPSLIASVRQLCHAHFDFEDTIEIVGLLCLEFDKLKKEKFSLNELIKSGLKPALPSYISKSLHENSSLSNPGNKCILPGSNIQCHEIVNENIKSFQIPETIESCSKNTSNFDAESEGSNMNQCDDVIKKVNRISNPDTFMTLSILDDPVHKTSDLKNGIPFSKDSLVDEIDITDQNVNIPFDQKAICKTSTTEDSNDSIKLKDNNLSKQMNFSSCSDTDPSLEIDIEKTDTSQEPDSLYLSSEPILNESTGGKNHVMREESEIIEKVMQGKDIISSQSEMRATVMQDENILSSQGQRETKHMCNSLDLAHETVVEEQSSLVKDVSNHQTGELPLDMSVLKSTVKQEPCHDEMYYQSPLWSESPHSKSGKFKEDIHASIPWQRRDMSRKEEYEFLEFHPFSDLAEFSQHYPHVHQRTYYRWKRRIKEEYIILEQCPDMSFQEFSSVVLQAKESVYRLWKSLIAQGKGFFAPSDSSKRLEAKCSLKPNMHNNEYIFLQKNLSVNYEQFCQQYPGVPVDVFNVLKRKVMQEFWLYYQNQHMSFNDFSKLVNISEDVFIAWRDYVENLKSSSISQSLKTGSRSMSPNQSGYYGMASPLGQQILPMMLWPQMMGLAGSISNPLGLSGPHGGNTSSSAVTSTSESSSGNVQGNSETPTSDSPEELNCKYQGTKRVAVDETDNLTKADSSRNDKKAKFSHEKDDQEFWSSVNRSRKQNKQEYVYYLKNPELGFKELESLFPTISLRTFYRWRKEMNAAVMLLEDNRDMTFHQFQMVFPDIPEEVFDLWKEKSLNGKPSEDEKLSLGKEIIGSNDGLVHMDSKCSSQLLTENANEITDEENVSSHNSVKSHVGCIGEETIHHRKYNKEEYLFVQKNPSIDFASFSKLYPNTSVRSFYRWKKELKDTVDYLKANPSISFEAFKTVDSSATEEVFNFWKMFAHNEGLIEDPENNETLEEKESRALGYYNRKANGPEYGFLQLNPYIEFSQFSRTYPDVPKRTFFRWKREIQQILNYVRAQPTIEFSDIASILPEVSQEVFFKWKQMVSRETNKPDFKKFDNDINFSRHEEIPCKPEIDKHTKSEMTKALLYLMHNPTVSFRQFNDLFEFVSPITFALWLKRIKTVVVHIAANPSIDYTAFKVNIKDVTEDIFNIWKNLSSDDVIAIDIACEEATKIDNNKVHCLDDHKDIPPDENHLQAGYEYCQKNPTVTVVEFLSVFPSLSEKLFHNWKVQIKEEIQFLRHNPNISFEEFSKLYPLEEEVFDLWKSSTIINMDEQIEYTLETSDVHTNDGFSGTKEESSTTLNKKVLATHYKKKSSDTLDSQSKMMEDREANEMPGNTNYPNDRCPNQTLEDNSIDMARESSLKLAKFAESVENLFKNNNNSLPLESALCLSPIKMESFLQTTSTPGSMHHAYPKSSSEHGLAASDLYGTNMLMSAVPNSSLSALMAMSRNKDEAFSSQRQKKMSRAEYMFVKDNPDVDSQEFSRIFPGVSARTFYRWKKEIKAQMQLA